MSHRQAPESRVLHAVRVIGFASGAVIAERAGTSHGEALRVLSRTERAGWVRHVAFAGLEGWSLTDVGKAENERRLAAEREEADPDGVIAAVYRDFLPLNARLLKAVTEWQIKPTAADQFARNDHIDPGWDERILNELALLSNELVPLTERLSAVLARFDGYATRYETALRKVRNGHHDWVDKTDKDSCHRVWFQLHEDLIATLGIDRRNEV